MSFLLNSLWMEYVYIQILWMGYEWDINRIWMWFNGIWHWYILIHSDLGNLPNAIVLEVPSGVINPSSPFSGWPWLRCFSWLKATSWDPLPFWWIISPSLFVRTILSHSEHPMGSFLEGSHIPSNMWVVTCRYHDKKTIKHHLNCARTWWNDKTIGDTDGYLIFPLILQLRLAIWS